jgi:hypothetical protein
MNERVNARSDDPSKARDVGREDPHNAEIHAEIHSEIHAEIHASPNEQFGTHATATAAPTATEHPPIDATTSDFSRCPFFRALTAATSAFAARQASLMRAEIAPVETDSTAPRASDPASRSASERA